MTEVHAAQPAGPTNAPAHSRWRRFLTVPRHIPVVFLWLTAVGSVAVVVLYRVVGDRWMWTELFTVWPGHLWGLPLTLLALPTINLRRPRRSLIALGCVALALLLTAEWRSLLRRPDHRLTAEFATMCGQPTEDAALRLLIWNVADHMSAKSDVLTEMARHRPDVCLLQETGDGPQSFLPSDLVGPWEGFHWIDAGDGGVLSRFPLESLPTLAADEHLGVQTVTLTLPDGRRVAVANVHLIMPAIAWNLFIGLGAVDFDLTQRWRTERLGQYAMLADSIDRLRAAGDHAAVIVAGDFNVPGHLWSLRPFRERLRDVWPRCGVGWGATMTDQHPMARIDHCWVSSEVEPVVARVHSSGVSDHRLLVVDLILRSETDWPTRPLRRQASLWHTPWHGAG